MVRTISHRISTFLSTNPDDFFFPLMSVGKRKEEVDLYNFILHFSMFIQTSRARTHCVCVIKLSCTNEREKQRDVEFSSIEVSSPQSDLRTILSRRLFHKFVCTSVGIPERHWAHATVGNRALSFDFSLFFSSSYSFFFSALWKIKGTFRRTSSYISVLFFPRQRATGNYSIESETRSSDVDRWSFSVSVIKGLMQCVVVFIVNKPNSRIISYFLL